MVFPVFFFFSSRRRHTRFSRDWSSDVCSSDLPGRTRRRLPTEETSMVRATVVPRGSAAFPLVTLAMVAVLSSAPVGLAAAAPAGSAARSGGWQSGGWQGTADGGTSVTLADVAKAVDAAGSGLDGTGVGVALIDTGVAPVPGLPAAHVVNGPDLSFESQANTLRYLDTYGHGTNMAGIIAGNDSATGFKGLAPGARLVSVKTGTAQ